MHSLFSFISAALFLIILFSDKGLSEINLPCKRCATAEECDQNPPELCVYGENRNYCNRRVCSKGPGEKCGERFNILGTCGEGLWCSGKDNRCHGCYIPTMSCYPE